MRNNDIELIIKYLPIKKNLGLDSFLSEFYKIFKEEITSVLYKVFQKIKKECFLRYSLKDITLIPKPGKISFENITKNQYAL